MEEIDLTLVASQKNRIMHLLREYHFDPLAFEWKTATRDELFEDKYGIAFRYTVSVLEHKRTGYSFSFEKHKSRYSPGHQLRTRLEPWNSLNDREEHIRDWLFNLQAEINEPDLWRQLEQQSKVAELASRTVENTPFSADERIYLSEQLETIRTKIIQTHQLETHQIEFLTERMEYLEEALNRFGRKDWLNLVFGVLATIVVSAAFAPEVTSNLLASVSNAIQPFIEVLKQLATTQ